MYFVALPMDGCDRPTNCGWIQGESTGLISEELFRGGLLFETDITILSVTEHHRGDDQISQAWSCKEDDQVTQP